MPPAFRHRLEHRGVDRTQQILAEVLGLGEQNVDQLFCLLLEAVELRLDLLLAFLLELRLLFLELVLRLGDFRVQILLRLRRQDGALRAFSSFDIRSASIPANWTARSRRIW